MNTKQTAILGSWQGLPRVAGYVAILVGFVVLLGSVVAPGAFIRFLPGLSTMDPKTALGLAMAGFGLHLLRLVQFSAWARTMSRICRVAVGLVGLGTLLEQLVGVQPSWSINEVLRSQAQPQGMPPAAAINFCILGAALVMFGVRRHGWISQFLALLATLFSLLVVTIHIYGASSSVVVGGSPMSLQTAFTFLLLGAGLLWANSHGGFLATFHGETEGAKLAQRLLPLAIAAPIVLGYLGLEAERQTLVSVSTARAVEALISVVVLGFFLWYPASALVRVAHNGASLERNMVETELRHFKVLEDVRDMVFTVDLGGQVQAANRAAREFFGWSKDSLQAVDVFRELESESSQALRQAMRDRILGSGRASCRLARHTFDNSGRLTASLHVIWRGTEPIGVQCVAHREGLTEDDGRLPVVPEVGPGNNFDSGFWNLVNLWSHTAAAAGASPARDPSPAFSVAATLRAARH
ncbi:MAG: PAS domain S-box protein [Bryobacteraceae bacterium]